MYKTSEKKLEITTKIRQKEMYRINEKRKNDNDTDNFQ